MTLLLVIAGIAGVAISGVPALLLPRGSETGQRLSHATLLLGATLGILGAIRALVAGPAEAVVPWTGPIGALSLHVDAIAAMFLLQVFVVGAAGSVYGLSYWSATEKPGSARMLRVFYGLTMAGLGTVFVAGDAMVFLVGWEGMALSAFFLVTTEDQHADVRAAGRLYLFCTKLATLCLFALFLLMREQTGSFRFTALAGAPVAVLIFGLVGFGMKAGIMPLHIWLPGAHGSAPSHVSALMSGVLIKAGIYGLVRLTSLCPDAPAWWGGLVLALGAFSAVFGVAFAIGQHDIKRLLAYHSIENIGIILLGLGLAMIGRSVGRADLVVLGIAGALLHTWNHGLFKALLFFAAGAVIHGSGVRAIDRMGGLARRMPETASAFLLGAVAICGLPPLNGFVSELFVYMGFLRSLTPAPGWSWLAGAMGAPALALTGALAALCFAKVYGTAFLGEPRTLQARDAHAAPTSMRMGMAVLAALCGVIGLAPLAVAPVLDRAAWAWMRGAELPPVATTAPLLLVSVLAAALLLGVAGGALLLRERLRLAPVAAGPTWDCGYAAPTPRMQYTATSFAENIVGLFAWALRPELHAPDLGTSLAPPRVSWHSHVPDPVLDLGVLPAARGVAWFYEKLRWIQRGTLQASLFYVLVALLFAFLVL